MTVVVLIECCGLGFAQSEDAKLRREIADAKLDSQRASAKLVMLEARQALLDGQRDTAKDRATRALAMLRALPTADETTDQILMCEGILSRVAERPQPPTLGEIPEMTPVPPAVGEPQARNSSPANRVSPNPDGIDHRPARLDDVEERSRAEQDRALHDWDEARRRHQATQRNEIKKDEVRLLDDANAARLAPDDWVTYPPDWPETARRRASKYPGGLIARSDSWVDNTGNEWYMGVYDIHNLIYMPPDFVPQGSLNPFEQQRLTLDRDALRFNSFLFRGFPEDVAAGIPLLRYFGGVDDLVYRGPKYSVEKQRQIEEMVRILLDDTAGQPALISLPPVQQRP
ncbi:MAG: hypothetical protein AB7N71_03835 [Phycisphaerae bacterium]